MTFRQNKQHMSTHMQCKNVIHGIIPDEKWSKQMQHDVRSSRADFADDDDNDKDNDDDDDDDDDDDEEEEEEEEDLLKSRWDISWRINKKKCIDYFLECYKVFSATWFKVQLIKLNVGFVFFFLLSNWPKSQSRSGLWQQFLC